MESNQILPPGPLPINAPRPEDLDNRRDVITRLYWDEGRDLSNVMSIMEAQHQFKATMKQYKTAFKRWGLQKHMSGKDMRHMVRIRKRRLEEDEKATHFSIKKRTIPNEKIDRWIQRSGFEHRAAMSGNAVMSETPPNIDYRTPSEHNSIADTTNISRTPKVARPISVTNLSTELVDIAAPNLSEPRNHKLTFDGNLDSYSDPKLDSGHWFTKHGPQKTTFVGMDTVFTQKNHMPPPPSGFMLSSATQTTTSTSQRLLESPMPMNRLCTEELSRNLSAVQAIDVDMTPFNDFLLSNETIQVCGIEPLQNTIGDSGPGILDPVMSSIHMSMHANQIEEIGHADTDSNAGSPADAALVTQEKDSHRDTPAFLSQQSFMTSDQETLGKHLRAAAGRGDESLVQQILRSSYVDVDSCSDSGRTALHNAASAGHVKILRDLLQAGADASLRVKAKNGKPSGLTALEVAINGNQLASLEVLLSSFCFNTDVADSCQEEVLRDAIKHAMQKRKLECLARLVRFFGWDWNDSVHYAIRKGYFYALRIFVDHQVNIDLADDDGDYPLHAAVRVYEKHFPASAGRSPQLEMIKFLLPKVSGKQRDALGRAPIHLAASRGYDEVIRLLLINKVDPNMRSENNQTALLYLYPAIKIPDQSIQRVVNCVLALSQAGADPSIGDENGNTLLHYVPELGRHFFRIGANLNMQNASGETPLFLAAKYTCSRGIRALLGSGADADIKNNSGMTPLSEAVKVNNLHVTQLLVDGKADPNVEDDGGQTPIFKAVKCRNLRILQTLLNAKANPNVFDKSGATPLLIGVQYGNYQEVKALIENGANANTKDKAKRTPLFDAVEFGWPDIITLLLNNGVDPNVQSNTGATPLFRAVRLKKDMEVKALLDGGADPDIRDKSGRTPLFEAALISHEPIVQLLLDGKADLNLQDEKGETALHAAIRSEDDSAIIPRLFAAGARDDLENSKGETARTLKDKYDVWNKGLVESLGKGEAGVG